MGTRFGDINKGPELAEAYTKLQAWRQQSRDAKITDYRTVAKTTANRSKPERSPGLIKPFNASNGLIWFETRVLSATQTGAGNEVATLVRTLLTGRADLASGVTLGANEISIRVPKKKFARVSATKRDTSTPPNTTARSRFTNLPYTRYRTDGASSPFGKKTATDTFALALNDIRTGSGYEAFVSVIGNRIGITPEQ